MCLLLFQGAREACQWKETCGFNISSCWQPRSPYCTFHFYSLNTLSLPALRTCLQCPTAVPQNGTYALTHNYRIQFTDKWHAQSTLSASKLWSAISYGENNWVSLILWGFFVANYFADHIEALLTDDYSNFPAIFSDISDTVYFSLVGDRLEGAEAGSRQAAVDTAIQSAAAHIAVQLGPALFYTLLHGSTNIDTCIQICTYKSVCMWICLRAHNQISVYVAHFFVCVFVGDGSADLGALEEDPRGVFSHWCSAGSGSCPHGDHLLP